MTHKQFISSILCTYATAASIHAEGNSTNAPAFDLELYARDYELESANLSTDNMPRRFVQYMATMSSLDIYDRLGPQAKLGLFLESQRGYSYYENTTLAGRDGVRGTIADAARETAVFYFEPLIQHWQLNGQLVGETVLEKTLSFLGKIASDTIGNTIEQRSTENAFITDYSVVHEVYLRELEKDAVISYGVRPRLDPYAYLGMRFGRHRGPDDRPIATIELRARYIFPGTERAEATALVPLPLKFDFVLEFRMAPLQEMQHDHHSSAFVLSLARNTGSRFFPELFGLRYFIYPNERAVYLTSSLNW